MSPIDAIENKLQKALAKPSTEYPVDANPHHNRVPPSSTSKSSKSSKTSNSHFQNDEKGQYENDVLRDNLDINPNLQANISPLDSIRTIRKKTRELNDRERIFVTEYVKTWNATQAARIAGYSFPGTTGYRMLRRACIVNAIQMSQKDIRILFNREVNKAFSTLIEVIEDRKAPAKARVDAAKDILDRAGYKVPDRLDLNLNGPMDLDTVVTEVTTLLVTLLSSGQSQEKILAVIAEVIKSGESQAQLSPPSDGPEVIEVPAQFVIPE